MVMMIMRKNMKTIKCLSDDHDDDDEDDDNEGDHYYDYENENNVTLSLIILLLIVIIILMFTHIAASHADTHSTFKKRMINIGI